MSRKKRPEGTRVPNGESSIYYSDADGSRHGWATVGVKDDGSPDRRHRMARDEKTLRTKVRELEKQRDTGTAGVVGAAWTVETWLDYWFQNIAKPTVRASSARAYRTAVYHRLIPWSGKAPAPESPDRALRKAVSEDCRGRSEARDRAPGAPYGEDRAECRRSARLHRRQPGEAREVPASRG